MATPAIVVSGIGKQYKRGLERARYKTLRDAIVNAVKAPLRRFKSLGGVSSHDELFWALKDVSFEVQPGEVVGLIGRNGAGKSTLLKILSRITEPTEGEVRMRGRVGCLLEVGTGFHAELTGRENIYLNGAILGMKKAEIDRKFDEIVAFAEVEKFLDTPVKHYSSGMYVRLGFAVAANLEPDILLVDEVLAVGDHEFQRRCLGKMKDVAGGGRTVVFVSHNLGAIQGLCQSCILLEQGVVKASGPTDAVVGAYVSSGRPTEPSALARTGNKKAVFEEFSLTDEQGRPADTIPMGGTLRLNLRIRANADIRRLIFSFDIRNVANELLTNVISLDEGFVLENLKAGDARKVQVAVPNIFFSPSDYFVSLWIGEDVTMTGCEDIPECLTFHVIQSDRIRRGVPFSPQIRTFMPTCWEALR